MGYHPAPRLGAFEYVGMHRYSVTCCTFKRRPWFMDPSIVGDVLSRLLRIMEEQEFEVTAYCFMKDHVHVLLEAQSDASALRPAMKRWKQACGFAHRHLHHVPLWQAGYYEHVLRDEADVLAAAAYITANPLRAGLTKSILDYPYCGSSRYSLEQLAVAIQSGRCRRHG
jgi:putative transposase